MNRLEQFIRMADLLAEAEAIRVELAADGVKGVTGLGNIQISLSDNLNPEESKELFAKFVSEQNLEISCRELEHGGKRYTKEIAAYKGLEIFTFGDSKPEAILV